MQALGPIAFDLVDPKPEHIDFHKIAVVLARLPRFGGQTERGTYSVAQHCEQGAQAILRDTGRRDWAAAFHLHDAHEAYINDITKPVQEAMIIYATRRAGRYGGGDLMRDVLRDLKAPLDAVIYPAAGLPWPLPEDTRRVVKEYDIRMCRTERDARLGPSPRQWNEPYASAVPVAGVDLSSWSENTAHARWMAAFREFCVDSTRRRV